MSEKRRKFYPKGFLAIHIIITLIVLLSVVPFNLNMRSYGMRYSLVPLSSSLLCCFLPLLLSFPFFDFSRQKMKHSPYRYRFLNRKSFYHLFSILMILVSLIILIIFAIQDSNISYEPVLLSSISIPLSYITTISTLILFEHISQPNIQEEISNSEFKASFSWTIFAFVIISGLIQFIVFFNFFAYGALAVAFLILFIIAMKKFLMKEKEKEIKKSTQISKPTFVHIILIIYSLITVLNYALLILYVLFLKKGYLIINFDEFYSGFFLAIQGSYVLFLIIFYSIIYGIMLRKKMFE